MITTSFKAYNTYIEMYIQKDMQYYIYVLYDMDTGMNFDRQQNVSFCYQKDRTSSRSVSVHPYLSYDSFMHTGEAMVTSKKLDIFSLSL